MKFPDVNQLSRGGGMHCFTVTGYSPSRGEVKTECQTATHSTSIVASGKKYTDPPCLLACAQLNVLLSHRSELPLVFRAGCHPQ